jgi:hypothetical protein
MGCRQEWDRAQLIQHLSKTFVNTTYKNHREKVLFERERAMLPETMPYVERSMRLQKINNKIEEHRVAIKNLSNQEQAVIVHLDPANTETGLKVIQELRSEIYNHQEEIGCLMDIRAAIMGTRAKIKHKSFIRGCPAEGCRGFVNMEWDCTLCNSKVCSKCHEVLGEGDDDATKHTCDADNVATAKLIVKDSKPCPKCSAMIFKIDGCDQMFCVQCHTAFSWKTGEIEQGRIHNPHFYEILRRSGVTPPREPGDNPIQCREQNNMENLLPAFQHINEIVVRRKMSRDVLFIVNAISRLRAHIRHVHLPTYVVNNVDDNRDLRIKYLMKELDEKSFMRRLQQKEKRQKKNLAITSVLELINTVIVDIITRFMQDENRDVLKEFDSLVPIVNDELNNIAKLYSCLAPRINEDYIMELHPSTA